MRFINFIRQALARALAPRGDLRAGSLSTSSIWML
jgi:hypothetical protein